MNTIMLAFVGELVAFGAAALLFWAPIKVCQLFAVALFGGNERVRGAQSTVFLIWMMWLMLFCGALFDNWLGTEKDGGRLLLIWAGVAYLLSLGAWTLWHITPADRAEHKRLVG